MLTEKTNNITSVVTNGLCHGCGTCSAICPTMAVKMALSPTRGIFLPEIDKDTCTACGLCWKICPGRQVNFRALYNSFFDSMPDDPWLGIWRKLLIAYSGDSELRHNASSGGAVSELLRFALREQFIDGALVTRMRKDAPLVAETFIARTPEEIISAKGSKYCPVHIADGLREVLKSKGRYAVVGLPCHLHGLAGLFDKIPGLRQKIPFVFGLMCSNNATLLATEFYLNKKGINPDKIISFRYRGDGWPGNIAMALEDGRNLAFPRRATRSNHQLPLGSSFHGNFNIIRCLTCCDHMSEFSDISFGDPRYPDEMTSETEGKNLLVIRTPAGEALYSQAIEAKALIFHRSVDLKEFYIGQNISFKRDYMAHINFRRAVGKPIPEYDSEKPADVPTISAFFRLLRYLPSHYSENRWIWPFLLPYAWLLNTTVRVINKFFKITGIYGTRRIA